MWWVSCMEMMVSNLCNCSRYINIKHFITRYCNQKIFCKCTQHGNQVNWQSSIIWMLVKLYQWDGCDSDPQMSKSPTLSPPKPHIWKLKAYKTFYSRWHTMDKNQPILLADKSWPIFVSRYFTSHKQFLSAGFFICTLPWHGGYVRGRSSARLNISQW